MAVLLISYDLNVERDEDEYEEFHEYIKDHSYVYLSESSYAIVTDLTPLQIYDRLRDYLDEDDAVVIVTLSAPHCVSHNQQVRDWLELNLPQ
jgi:hypothetical protein